MGRRDRRHAVGRILGWLPVVLVLAILAAGVAAWRWDLGPRWFGLGQEEPDPAAGPAAVPPPPGFELPALTSPDPVARTLPPTGAVSRVKIAAALTGGLADKDLGRSVHAVVAPLGAARPLFEYGDGTVMPASTNKLLTTTAALDVLGPGHTFTTSVVRDGRRGIVLVGGGDPYLASKPAPGAFPQRADLRTLAHQTAAALRRDGHTRVSLGYDASLFSGPAVNPHWPATYVPEDVVSPITALWADQGRPASGYGREADPPRAAADYFAAYLRDRGITVLDAPRATTARPGAPRLAAVHSAPLADIVEHTLDVSDNEAAEVLAHQVGLAVNGQGSFAGGVAGVRRTLESLGVDLHASRWYDGSGLSREDRIDPRTLVAVLQAAAAEDHPALRSVVTGLPVAGFTGSLTSRFDNAGAVGGGWVRAKTGTLSGVSALAGIAVDRNGDQLVFALVADRVRLQDTLDARVALDDAAADLAACRCGR